MTIVRLASVFLLAGVTACAPGASTQSASGAQAAETGTDAQGATATDGGYDPMCAAQLTWLQKDAYASHAGRTSTYWPPHTTTQIDVSCADGTTLTAVRENHGSKPTDVDASGQPLLVATRYSPVVEAPLSTVRSLLTAYAGCECAPTTAFLSLDAIGGDQKLVQMVTALATDVQANLACTDTDVSQLVSWLQAGDVDDVLEALPSCSFTNGESWSDAFTNAATSVLGDTWNSYHVCNNDAQLESALWDTFAAGQPISACDSTSALCRGPVFVYNP